MGVGVGSLEAHSSRALPLCTSISGNALVTVVHARSSARRLRKTQAGIRGVHMGWVGALSTEREGGKLVRKWDTHGTGTTPFSFRFIFSFRHVHGHGMFIPFLTRTHLRWGESGDR